MTICQNNNAGLNAFSPAKWQERRNNMKKQVIITNDGSLSLSKLVRDLEANGFEVKLVESDGKTAMLLMCSHRLTASSKNAAQNSSSRLLSKTGALKTSFLKTEPMLIW